MINLYIKRDVSFEIIFKIFIFQRSVYFSACKRSTLGAGYLRPINRRLDRPIGAISLRSIAHSESLETLVRDVGAPYKVAEPRSTRLVDRSRVETPRFNFSHFPQFSNF